MSIYSRLSKKDISRLKHSAKVAQRLEDRWADAVNSAISEAITQTLHNLENGLQPVVPDLETIFIEHTFQIAIMAMRGAEDDIALSGRALPKVPRTLADLMAMYDAWRNGRYKPPRPAKQAQDIQKRYLKKVQSVWQKYSEDFRSGNEFTQREVKKKIQQAAETTGARAQIIVRTETTSYYNTARKAFYDASPDVTHYLFLAVRDKATTRWCTPSTLDGKRGRHGLVYEKGSPELARETPACHWNCRSELLPLTPANPGHKRLIDDPKIARENVQCYPLPRGWRAGG